MPGKKIKKPVQGRVAKVPVVMQLEALECGAACLCMVMAYYGKWIPLERVRSDCGVSRDGSNARNVIEAARSYGMEAAGYSLEPAELKEQGLFPCIIHWELNHFVVCDGFRGDRVYLNDPARGTYSVSIEQFDESYTGICLMLEPGEGFEPGGSPGSMIRFAAERLKGAGSAVAFVALTTVISSLTSIAFAGFSRVFLDYLLPGHEPGWIIPFFIGMGLLVFVQVTANYINAVYSLRIDGKMAAVGNATYLWKVLKLPMEFFSQRMAGDIQGRKDSNATISERLVNTLSPLVLNTAMMLFYVFVMVRYSVKMTLVGLSSLVINLILSRYISSKRVNITRVAMRDRGKLDGATVAAVDMIETIKSNGAENGYFERWSGYQASVNTQNVRCERLNNYLGMIPLAVSQAMNAIILIMGVNLAIHGHFTVGMILAFQTFLNSMTGPADRLISAGQTVQEMRTDMERVNDVMKYPDCFVFNEQDIENETEEFNKLSGSLVMENVTFGYSKLASPLIENFSLEMKRGQRIAFVGASGCGKSTLSKLISGLYQPWSGRILFDGKEISEIDRNIFTGSVAVVDQDITLFEDTISGNIKMWDNSIEDFEVIMASVDAQIHEDIMQREGGYRYRILEGGRDFSGGQRQRLEIARVLAQDPTMIILDEATSALDAATEYEVVESIRKRGISCIVIAHRLSTIRDCDEIIVLDHGKVVERGTHEELMALHGTYECLVTSD